MKIIISVSEQFLFDENCNINTQNQKILVEKICELKKIYNDVVIVTSGSIPMGKSVLHGTLKEKTQYDNKIYASMGQAYLSLSYAQSLKKYDVFPSSLLLAIDDLYNSKVKIDVFVSSVLNTDNQIPFIYRNHPLEKPNQMLNLGGKEYEYGSYSLSIFLYKILCAGVMFYIDNDYKLLLNQDSYVRTLNYEEGALGENAFAHERAYNLWSNLSILGNNNKYKKPVVFTAIHENTSFVEMVRGMSDGCINDSKTTTVYA